MEALIALPYFTAFSCGLPIEINADVQKAIAFSLQKSDRSFPIKKRSLFSLQKSDVYDGLFGDALL
ncbi:MAG TPA: hypothetical protein V6D25_18755 [Leptolyngbyaceae cyanobacterium]